MKSPSRMSYFSQSSFVSRSPISSYSSLVIHRQRRAVGQCDRRHMRPPLHTDTPHRYRQEGREPSNALDLDHRGGVGLDNVPLRAQVRVLEARQPLRLHWISCVGRVSSTAIPARSNGPVTHDCPCSAVSSIHGREALSSAVVRAVPVGSVHGR